MLNFFIKKSEVVLDCFTIEPTTFNLFPISSANNFIPNWWRELDKNPSQKNQFVGSIPTTNMRGCAGFVDFYKNGYIMPLWSDVIIETNGETYNYQFSDQTTFIETHDSYQYNNSFKNFHHIKLVSSWYIKSKHNINFFWTSPFWNYSDDEKFLNNFHFVPGILNFKYGHSTNINFFVSKNVNRFYLRAGMPLVYLYPDTDKKIIFKNHLVTPLELQNIIMFKKPFFNFNYRRKSILLNQNKSH